MNEPGEQAGECPRCGTERIQVGYESVVLAVYCAPCDILTGIGNIDCKTQTEEMAEVDR